MSYEPSLNELLAQTANAYGLRDVLTGHGIPKDEPVICNITNSDGEVVASYQIPPGTNEVPLTQTDLKEDMLKILNQGEDGFGLVSAFPDTETSLFELSLDIDTAQISERAVDLSSMKFSMKQCVPCSVCIPGDRRSSCFVSV